MNIAISGAPGSGKSTLARAIASHGWETVSAGSIMRKRARELDVSIAEMQAHAGDEGIDHAIDRAVAEVPATTKSRFLIDARMGWAFAPRCLSVLVTCSPEVAGARVFAARRDDEAFPSAEAATRSTADPTLRMMSSTSWWTRGPRHPRRLRSASSASPS